MLGSLLTTKLYFPPARPALVPRPRLVERLQAGLNGPLTLLSAPAGSGKTTLLSEWRAGVGAAVPLAWLSLDEADNDPFRFFHHLAACLDLLQPGVLNTLLPYLQASTLPPQEVFLAPLINSLNDYPQDFILALDDVHVLETPSIHAALAFLLDHLPPRMHLVLLTRADPVIPLGRLRARGHLTEIRAEHLRFTLEETSLFLRKIMDLQVRPEQVAALEKRTEGWIAGLQLAALSMQGREDVDGFVSAFTGSNHYIVDYLGEEVLSRQSEPQREFLLRTSIVERLTGPLCDALTDGSDGAETLEKLDHANIFVIPLDKDQCWYRYHQLFAELLRNRLLHACPELVPELHGRASRWFESHGFMDEAIDHALAARDFHAAARLFCKESLEVMYNRTFHTLERWLKAFPPEFIKEDPCLCIAMAHVLWGTGRRAQIPPWAAWAEQGLASRLKADPSLAGSPEYKTFLGETFAFQSLQAQADQHLPEAVELARKAVDLIPKTVRNRAYALGSLYIALSLSGDIDGAIDAAAEAVALTRTLNYPSMLATATYTLCHLLRTQGRHPEAERAARETLDHAGRLGQLDLFYYGIVYVALADVYTEWNELDKAEALLLKSLALVRQGGMNILQINATTSYIGLLLTRREYTKVMETLDGLDRLAAEMGQAEVHLIVENIRLQCRAEQGDLTGVSAWLEKADLAFKDRMSTDRIEDIYQGCVYLSMLDRKEEAARLLDELEAYTEKHGLAGFRINILVTKASALKKEGKETQALACLARALTLARPCGLVHPFLMEGPVMRDMLRSAQKHSLEPEFTARLLAAFQESLPGKPPSAGARPSLLSKRELELLQLLADGCSNKDIAARLVISLGTVKRHTVNIFNKLDVQNRTEAVARARELKLL